MAKTLALLAALIFVAGPAVAVEETTRITAVAETTDQFSGTITRPPDAKGLIIIMHVTAGITPLLDANVQTTSPSTTGVWYSWVTNCGSATAIGVFGCVLIPKGNFASYLIPEKGVMVPSEFRIQIDHGNANAITYNVYTQWVR